MKKIILPDPLIWQSGIEYAFQALAILKNNNFLCYIANKGPFLEAITCAALELDLVDKIRYVDFIEKYINVSDLVLFPRVCPLNNELAFKALDLGKITLVSDNEIQVQHNKLIKFPKRNWKAIYSIIENLIS